MSATSTPAAYLFPPYRLLPAQRLLLSGDAPVKLGGRAFDMLVALVERRERTVGKPELMDLVWPRLVVEENNLQVQVVALRKLLGHAAIATVPGRGYRFTLPVTVEGAVESAAPQGRLPSAAPLLFGRDEDLRALDGLLDAHALVTIAGPAGIGKTRLAQAAARARADALPGGVWWVDLASLADPALLPQAVAQAVGVVPDAARDVVAAVGAALSRAAALLVLDNAEHLLGAVVEFVARLRAAAPQLRLLVTSQEVLHMSDEQVFRPEPLALPAGDDPERLAASGAVALFVARAQAADRRFELNADNRAAVADICRRLDGIPLAIELAAARVPLLGVAGLRERLDQRLHVLTAGDRNAPRRHQTLRAALEWSHQLLSAPEQAVLRRLGVFAGGFTLEAAQQVAEDGQGIDAWDALELLGTLVDKSLVAMEEDAAPRYRMLETTRLFALERLIEAGEAADARTRHREHFVTLAEEAREQMLVADPRGLARLDRERDNLFLALAWRQHDEDGSRRLRLAAALRYWWTSRGLLPRGVEVMRAALDHAGAGTPSVARCHVLGTLAHFASLMGDRPEARQRAAQAVQAARELGDERCLCAMLCGSGFIELRQGDTGAAGACAQEALALGRRIGDSHELGNALSLLAALHGQQGEPAQARQLLEEGVAMRRRLNHLWSQAVGQLNLAQMAVELEDAAAALPHLQEVLSLLPRIDSEYIGLHLIGISAVWAAAVALNEDAVRLESASLAQHARLGIQVQADEAQQQCLARARAALDAATGERLQAEGRGWTYRQALQQLQTLLAAQPAAGFSLSKA
jgi:predicted ATPase/DNA-binding winged helix-turn-helix (wHTH) protein